VTVYLSTGKQRWCALRSAHPGGHITTLCRLSLPYAVAVIATFVPPDLVCPSCRAELAAGTPVTDRSQP